MICFKLLLFFPSTTLWCWGEISKVICTWTWVCKQQDRPTWLQWTDIFHMRAYPLKFQSYSNYLFLQPTHIQNNLLKKMFLISKIFLHVLTLLYYIHQQYQFKNQFAVLFCIALVVSCSTL
jgi:hypothetical protein